MEQKLDYKPGTILQFDLNTQKRVAIQSAKRLAPILDLKFPVEESVARMMGRWIIECHNSTLLLREVNCGAEDDRIVVSFEEGNISLTLKRVTLQGTETSLFSKIKQVDIYPKEVQKIKFTIEDTGGTTTPCQNQGNSTGVSTPAVQPSSAQNNAQIQQLQAALTREKNINSQLQAIIDGRVEELLQFIKNSNVHLNNKITSNVQDLEMQQLEKTRLQNEINEQNALIEAGKRAVEKATADLETCKEESSRLDSQKEMLELDCEEAKKQLEELKMHIHLDSDTLTLMEDDSFLKHGTI